jgi:hypothetical protein
VSLHDGQIAYVYFLFEHKSYPDRLVALQLLRYLARFWEQQVSAGQFPLPPIMPLVVYHGERWIVGGKLCFILNHLGLLVDWDVATVYSYNEANWLLTETANNKTAVKLRPIIGFDAVKWERR